MNNIHDLMSISQPILDKSFPVNIQLRETQQTRRLENFKRYEHLWKSFDDKVQQHYIDADHIKSGKSEMDKQMAKEAITTSIQKKVGFACDIEVLQQCGHLDRVVSTSKNQRFKLDLSKTNP